MFSEHRRQNVLLQKILNNNLHLKNPKIKFSSQYDVMCSQLEWAFYLSMWLKRAAFGRRKEKVVFPITTNESSEVSFVLVFKNFFHGG